MQCSSCRAVYSNGLDVCPRCKTPAVKSSPETATETATSSHEGIASAIAAPAAEEQKASPAKSTAQVSSTLLEFPGVSRASRPQWRKELSERVREIQERRARDGARDTEENLLRRTEQPAAEVAAPQLGLVPPPDAPVVNPIVAAALKRLERARQPLPPMPRPRASRGGAAAAAIARVAEDQYQTEAGANPAQMTVAASLPIAVPAEPSKDEKLVQAKAAETAREHTLVVVPVQQATKDAARASQPKSKRVAPEIVDEAAPALPNAETPAPDFSEEIYDDRAPALSRVAGSVIDLLVVAFASSPFAAIIELTNGNWGDWRVLASMAGIVLVVMFLYLTAATALAGRTWGMSLVSLRAVDAETGLPPTTKQAVGRAVLYIASLLTLGLGIIYALVDAEKRTAHDHFTGTAVVRE